MPKFDHREVEAVTKALLSDSMSRYRGGEGGFVDQFEAALCRKINVAHSLTVNSGTSALICALTAMKIGPGDEVIVPAYTWIASALAVFAVGAVPVLAEIDETLTIDVVDVENKISDRTKAIIPVHMLNCSCDMDAIMALAARYKLLVLEDACQAIGVIYKGRRLGSIGNAGAFSFNWFKNITCGEGGAVLTSNREIYERALIYHDAGAFTRKYAGELHHELFPGVNYRVSEIQGAILGEQLKKLDTIIETHVDIAAAAAKALALRGFRIFPHHDRKNAANVAINFATREEADAFGAANNMKNLLELAGRHVYTNWVPFISRTKVHPALDPYKWADSNPTYDEHSCPRTLDILARTFSMYGFCSQQQNIEEAIGKLIKP